MNVLPPLKSENQPVSAQNVAIIELVIMYVNPDLKKKNASQRTLLII